MTTKQPNPGQTSRVLHTDGNPANDPSADHGNGERMKEARQRLEALQGKIASLQTDDVTRDDIQREIDALRNAL